MKSKFISDKAFSRFAAFALVVLLALTFCAVFVLTQNVTVTAAVGEIGRAHV